MVNRKLKPPNPRDELLVKMWHSDLTLHQICMELGISQSQLYQCWSVLRTQGELPKYTHRTPARKGLLRKHTKTLVEAKQLAQEYRDQWSHIQADEAADIHREHSGVQGSNELLERLKKHHPELDPEASDDDER